MPSLFLRRFSRKLLKFIIKPELLNKYFKQFGTIAYPLIEFTINSGTSNKYYRSGDVMGKSLLGFTIRPKFRGNNYKQFGVIINPLKGFTIIELLIVITILSITGTLVTTSYLSFERRQKVKNSALEIKSQIRLAQNNALTGYKGKEEVGGLANNYCDESSTLVGWYSRIDTIDNSISSAGICSYLGTESIFLETIKYVDDTINILNLNIDGSDYDEILILFQPIKNGALYYEVDGNSNPPIKFSPFLDARDEIIEINTKRGNNISLTLEGEDGSNGTIYNVEIRSSGEVNEYEN